MPLSTLFYCYQVLRHFPVFLVYSIDFPYFCKPHLCGIIQNTEMKIKIVNRSAYPAPAYATEMSAGMDLKADIQEAVTLEPLKRAMISTGLSIALPKGFEAQVRPRSGLAAKHGITVLNSPGTVDADYRGEIKVILVNLSDMPFTINPGERIAQMVIARHEQAEWEEVEVLDETGRGEGGFGSTGRQ